MPFIAPDNREFDLATKMSRQLFNAVAKFRTIKNYMSKEWTKYMHQLLKERDTTEVQETLDWYCENMGGEFVPKVASSRYFREKYDAIRAAMTREGTGVKVCKEAQEFAKELAIKLNWPVEVREKLPELVQLSRDNILTMVKAACVFIARGQKGNDDRDLVFINTVVIHRLKIMLTTWFDDLAARLWRPHYDGDVMKLAFRMDSERFKTSHWRDWSYQWCGDGKAYDDLLAALIKESKS